ncbi:hypothetical protein Taro_004767 [Colocasia esculenta]|uniref:U3 small nucleolar RNA-associated protein 25 n=1 Tax=Colocasia esculenta TaxID=4460 RepID=A0A843TN47_COLES|nr:hypothetical protein [Colocasia esculenta]
MFVRHLPTPPTLPSTFTKPSTIKPSIIKPPPTITLTTTPPTPPTPLATEPEQPLAVTPITQPPAIQPSITPPQSIQLSTTPIISPLVRRSRREFSRSKKSRQHQKEVPRPGMLFKIPEFIPRISVIICIPGMLFQHHDFIHRMSVIVHTPGTSLEQKSPPPTLAVKRPLKNMPIISIPVASRHRFQILIGNLSLKALVTPHTVVVNLPTLVRGSASQIVLTHSKVKSLAQSITHGVVPLSISNIIQALGTVPLLLLPNYAVEPPTFSSSIISTGLPLTLETPMEANASLLLPPTLPVELPTLSINYISRGLPLLDLFTPARATTMQIVHTHFEAKPLAQSTTQARGMPPLMSHDAFLGHSSFIVASDIAGGTPTLSLNSIPRELSLFIETSTEVNNFPLIFEGRSIQRRRARPSARWARYVRRYLRFYQISGESGKLQLFMTVMGKHHVGIKRKVTTKGFKRTNMQESTKDRKKVRCVDDKCIPAFHPYSPHSESISEESLESIPFDQKLQQERPMFDNLLKVLSSASRSLSDAYKMRQREQEGANGTEDEKSTSESSSVSEVEYYSEEGYNADSGQQKLNLLERKHAMEEQEASETDNSEESGSNHEQDVESDDGNDYADESVGRSSFHDHFGLALRLEEIDDLMKKIRKFKWEIPALDSSMSSKCVGTGECFLKDIGSDLQYGLLLKLYKHWLKEYEASGARNFHSSRQRQFFSLCNSYRDIMHCNKKPFYLKGVQEDSSVMDAYIIHAINHVFRTRDIVIKNDARLSKDEGSTKDELLLGDDFRDQGFTRPKVLFLLPYRSFAFRLVKRLIRLTPLSKKGNVEHLGRFCNEFGNGEDALPNNAHEPEKSKEAESRRSRKPEDHQILFGGNNDDCFVMGIKFTRWLLDVDLPKHGRSFLDVSLPSSGCITETNHPKRCKFVGKKEKKVGEQEKKINYLPHAIERVSRSLVCRRSIRLYGDFYSCDMIVASPLGLSKKIAETTKEKEKDVDYLSSIEVLIIDHADVIAMQNWSHLTTVVEQLNHLPSKQHRTDFMRVRQWYLDGQARFYRQTILLGSFLSPDMNSLFNRLCVNLEGKIKLVHTHKGVLPKILLPVRQVYERFDASSIDEIDDARFDYFVKKVFPKMKDSIQGGIMLFISSYLDFVRIRNFLKSQNASLCLLGEYTKQSDISRARVWFFQGSRKIMLYTERAHFYHRYKIRGIQNLLIYSLPERKDFYHEVLNMLDESKSMTCNVLFSRFDHLRVRFGLIC